LILQKTYLHPTVNALLFHPRGRPSIHKVVSVICTLITTYSFVISKLAGMTVSQVADEVLYIGLIEMQELDAPG